MFYDGRVGARLLYRDVQGREGEVELAPDVPVYVGRSLDCAVRTDDAMVSRKHTMIHMEQGRVWVEDLGSSNGTHVNDERVTRQVLEHNDVVRCGSMWLRYVEDGAPASVVEERKGGTLAGAPSIDREPGRSVAPSPPAADAAVASTSSGTPAAALQEEMLALRREMGALRALLHATGAEVTLARVARHLDRACAELQQVSSERGQIAEALAQLEQALALCRPGPRS